jgi:hypothetical protein
VADDGQSVMSALRPGAAIQEKCADALAPDRAVHASRWESLREPVAPYPIARAPSPFNDATRVEARRLLLVTLDTDVRPVTEFAVRLRFEADPSLTADELSRARSSLLEGVDRYFNYRHTLADGSQFHLRVEPTQTAFDPAAPTGAVVTLHPGRGDRPGDTIDQTSWYADMDPVVFAHEIGHHLGLPDEYVQLGSAGRATLTSAGVRLDASLMGEARMTG